MKLSADIPYETVLCSHSFRLVQLSTVCLNIARKKKSDFIGSALFEQPEIVTALDKSNCCSAATPRVVNQVAFSQLNSRDVYVVFVVEKLRGVQGPVLCKHSGLDPTVVILLADPIRS